MPQSDTVQRILDAAEVLFAQKGFAETSLRAITSRAGVNLAAVNYHFGSKEALIQAVFERYLTPFCQALDAKLEELEGETRSGGEVPLEKLFTVASRLALECASTAAQTSAWCNSGHVLGTQPSEKGRQAAVVGLT